MWRLRRASEEKWDGDRCELEAQAFVGEMMHRGWRHNPDINWRSVPAEMTPEKRQWVTALMAEAKRNIREQRPRPPATVTEIHPDDDGDEAS